MRKFLFIILAVSFVVLMLPSVHAFEIDNVGVYDEDKREITLVNSFNLPLLRKDLATVTLISELEVFVMRGNDVLVAEYEINNIDAIYNRAFTGIEFVNQRTGRATGKDIWYRIKVKTGTEVQPIYEDSCSSRIDERNMIITTCTKNKIGSQVVDIIEWQDFDINNPLPKGVSKLGIFTDVKAGESIDWIPEIMGVKIPQWAVWTEALEVDILAFYNLDTSAGVVDDFFGNNDGTNNGTTRGVAGKILNASDFERDDGESIAIDDGTGTISQISNGNWTISMWIQREELGYNQAALIGGKILAEQQLAISFNSANNLGIAKTGIAQTFGTISVADTDFHFITVVVNASADRALFYFDGVFNSSVPWTHEFNVSLPYELGTAEEVSYFDGLIDMVGIWNRSLTDAEISQLYNNGDGLQASAITPLTVALNSPANAITTPSSTQTFNASAIPTALNITNATLMLYNTTTTLFTSETNTLDFDSNESIFDITGIIGGSYIWNVEFCGIINNATGNTFCNVADSNRTFTIAAEENTVTFDDFTYETDSQTYSSTITLTEGDTVSSVNLFYNGTSIDATSVPISGNNFTLSSTFDVPTAAIGQNTTQFFFSVNSGIGQTNFTIHNQSVGAINLSLFGQGIGGLAFINFSFTNETVAQERVGATFASTWSYYLGSGTVNKTLSFTNASENLEYVFQLHPQNRTLQADLTTNYNNADSQQRTFDPTTLTLTNATSLQTLFLLPNSDGVFQQFATVENNGDVVADVSFVINRTIGGSSQEVTSGTTDSSGFASTFLNPDFSYQGTFTKTGFAINSFTFTPSNQLRTVVMGGGELSAIGNGTTIATNTTYTIQPSNSSLANSTSHTFSFNVSSSQAIILISMNITNSSGFQVGFQSSAGTGFISQIINTGENNSFIGTFIIQTADELIVANKVWNIGTLFIGDYSIFRQGTLYLTYGFRDMIRFLIVIFIIGGTLIFMSGSEVIDTSESKISVALLLVWAFSILGWLTVPGAILPGANENISLLSQFGNKYGIAILSSGIGFFFIARRVFRAI